MHPAVQPVNQLLKHCRVTTGRRSGPGGQHRNKVETAIVVKHLPTGIEGQASEQRSQAANREQAIHRLRLNLAVQVRSQRNVSKFELPPTNSCENFDWASRIVKEKLAVSERHIDFPSVLADLLDHAQANDWNLTEMAQQSGTSGSQIVKLLRKHPPALDYLNQQRATLGLAKLS